MAIRFDENEISLAVRDLAQMNRDSGTMLSSYTLPQRGVLGKQAQVKLQQHRDRSFGLFHSEYTVRHTFEFNGFIFHLHGRIDGIYRLEHRIEVEEIKSVVLTAADFKKLQVTRHPEHAEQLLFYCWLLHLSEPETEIQAVLRMVNLVNDQVRNFNIPFSPLTVQPLVYSRFQRIIDERLRENGRAESRSRAFGTIPFPFPGNRPQQQQMMDKLSSVLNESGHLLVSAPTGTGKTAAALYPAIRYGLANKKRIFFATARNTQQAIVRETIGRIVGEQFEYTALFLRSAQNMCANDTFFCHEDYCPYARRFKERLAESNLLNRLLQKNVVLPDDVCSAAADETLCPFEVQLELTGYADLICGDVNYVFDPASFLRRLFGRNDFSGWLLILDEAHNLYQRGMEYYSPRLPRTQLDQLIRETRGQKSVLHRNILSALQDIDSEFARLQQEGESHFAEQQHFITQPAISTWQSHFAHYENVFIKYMIHKIRKGIITKSDPYEEFYFALRHFIRVLEFDNAANIAYYDADRGGQLGIQCCDPADLLGQRINAFHSVIAMSATLDPIDYYRSVLGFDGGRTRQLQLDSPFPPDHRQIVIVPGLSTKYKNRTLLYPEYARIVENIVRLKKGNYLVFLPSFEFLQNINLFLARLPGERILQKPGMSDSERDSVLQRLRDPGKPKTLFAVLGGIFSEGIDFAGDMCIGVIVFSTGLPRIGFERELIREYFEQKSGTGFDYAYLYPGMNKVIQAVGRLIRSHQDRGIIALIDERFADDHVNGLLPAYWFQQDGDVVISDKYQSVLRAFWKRQKDNS
jgi:DNA excision repair protein ERCC-2